MSELGATSTTDDVVERLGIERARQEAAQADLILWVVDGHDPEPPEPEFYAAVFDKPHLLLLNKVDLGLAPWTDTATSRAMPRIDSA